MVDEPISRPREITAWNTVVICRRDPLDSGQSRHGMSCKAAITGFRVMECQFCVEFFQASENPVCLMDSKKKVAR